MLVNDRDVAPTSTPDPAQLQQQLINWRNLADGAYATNTERAWASDWRIWHRWCQQTGNSPLPASPEAISTFLIDIDRKPATLRRYLSTLATAHRAAGLANPCCTEAVQLTLRKLTRLKGRAQQQAPALSWPELQLILAQPGNRLIDHRDRALLVLMYDSLVRRSDVLGIEWPHIERSADGSGTLYLPRSKTDQEGEGQYRYLSPLALDLIVYYQQQSGINGGAVFRGVYNGSKPGPKGLSSEGVNRVLKRAGAILGRDLSGHSCRVGATQDMTAANIDLAGIMQAGGWQSERMPAQYGRKLRAGRSGMAQLATLQRRR